MMAAVSVSEVSRKVATGGGTPAAISVMSSSGMGPGPLGMCETSPSASAPCAMAARAPAGLLMQQILTKGFRAGTRRVVD